MINWDLGDERRLDDNLWVNIEGYNDEGNHTTALRPANDDEIAAAHPKCGTCDYCDSHDDSEEGECGNEFSYSYMQEVNLFTDYCPQHSKLHPPKEGNGDE